MANALFYVRHRLLDNAERGSPTRTWSDGPTYVIQARSAVEACNRVRVARGIAYYDLLIASKSKPLDKIELIEVV